MADKRQGASARQQEGTRRQERANRILDAAAVLIQRWGYNKTTLDDISRQSGIAKGTIYLHWRTREELFAALMKRELTEMAEDFQQRVSADPTASTLRGIHKHSALALMKRPLLKAAILRDITEIGKLARSSISFTERITGFKTYLEFLREHGLVRTDLSLPAQVYIVIAVFMGFFLVAPLMPDEFTFSDEELAELLGETIHRVLEVSPSVPLEEPGASQAFTRYVNRAVESVQKQFQKEIEP